MPAFNNEHAERFTDWLLERVISDARGDELSQLLVAPDGRFWLGRLAPETVVQNSRLGERAERLDPCEMGMRVRPTATDGRRIRLRLRAVGWILGPDPGNGSPRPWNKTNVVNVEVMLETPTSIGDVRRGGLSDITGAFTSMGAGGLAGEFRSELEQGREGPELVITFVNTSPAEIAGGAIDPNFYEVNLQAEIGDTLPFTLDALPDSFRYDRTVAAYGINCGVKTGDRRIFTSEDFVRADRPRPIYWNEVSCGVVPDLSFARLGDDPLPPLQELAGALRRWGDANWSPSALETRKRAAGWSDEMLGQATSEAALFRDELSRLDAGVRLLDDNDTLRRAFCLMNQSFARATADRGYNRWRPFQIGFVLATLSAIDPSTRDADADIVDTLWFATGGGKTETYLGVLITAAFLDRLTGKTEGITGWARFPLRMLSLQQTQRFADAFAAAELIRREQHIDGEGFAVGFLVGPGTPNRIKPQPSAGEPNPADPDMPRRYQVLLSCPFCRSTELEMRFSQDRWSLEHVCTASSCSWRGALPFYIVDNEIFRFLPTVVVGTLDKAANISMQAAMRAFYGAPHGKCPTTGHGFTYAPRSQSPGGCIFPGCSANSDNLALPHDVYAPRIRIQDELHLLRDTLGAVDTHYEALLDHLQQHWGSRAKIAASSATLAGYEKQVETLYQRRGRLFPLPGPQAGDAFWTTSSDRRARSFVGLAPRGVTLEYASDRSNETLQRAVREALADPAAIAHGLGIPEVAIPELASYYGVDVIYGSTLRDVEAAARSFDTEVNLNPLNSVTLTGATPLDEVRDALRRLNDPEADFGDRIHLVAASSMLSHGIDVDRLNVMVMLGIPLSTAEFIQTTSRVGRAHPGLVLVLHKIMRERDAAVYRSFGPFIKHADRLVDPIPITRRSRRVLELTFAGLFMGRVYGVHEPQALAQRLRQLTTVRNLRRAFQSLPVREEDELQALIELLGATGPLDEGVRRDLEQWVRELFRAIHDPATSATWPSELIPTGEPMLSLRDVEAQAPVFSRGGS